MNVWTDKAPLWFLIEEKIQDLGSQDLSGGNLENAVQGVAKDLDGTGYNVTLHAGNMLRLRRAMAARAEAGHPLMNDFSSAIEALTLDDVEDTLAATAKVVSNVGEAWPDFKLSERKPDIHRIVERAKLDLLVAKAKGLDGEQGIRLLIAESIAPAVIIERLEISDDDFAKVNAAVEAERAERDRVRGLIKEVKDKTDEEKVKHLINKDVTDELIVEIGGFDAGTVDAARKAMEEELKEKKRLAEEEAARKKAEAEGPPIEEIPDDQLLEYIESVREILEFSDQEGEIRTMCEQSSIPKALVDIAVADPDKLDELESKAGG
jgi:hypothetical protein